MKARAIAAAMWAPFRRAWAWLFECPHCGSRNIVSANFDFDRCKDCGKYF